MTEDTPRSDEDTDGATPGERIAEDLPAYSALTGEFYRGEVDRATTWRSRLDQTTNWAVVVVAAILTWAFSSAKNPHYVILIGMFGITAFLIMEATRYREYDVFRGRIRTLQSELFADAFGPDRSGGAEWEASLSDELRDPRFEMSFLEALNHRLRRSYMALLLILLVAWIARITIFETGEPWRQTASILVLPGDAVLGAVTAFYALLIGLTLWSARGERIREFQE